MKEKERKDAPSRRDFLRFASVCAPASVAAVATAATRAEADGTDSPAKAQGWRETAHIRAYLDSARF